MKKLFYAILLILSVGILATSCEKNDPVNQSIIGTWKVTEVTPSLNSELAPGDTFTFKTDGTFWAHSEYDGDIGFFYTREGSTIIFSYNPSMTSPMTMSILSLTSTTMELKLETYTIKFKKV